MNKKNLSRLGRAFVKRYIVDALGAMALGLFSSLIIGVILNQLFNLLGLEDLQFAQAVIKITGAPSPVVGAAIAVAIAYGLKAKPLAMYAAAAAGAIGYSASVSGISAGPLGAYIAAVLGVEAGSFLAGKTKLDILIVPAAVIIVGALAGTFVGPPLAAFMRGTGDLVNRMTLLRPLPMGIAVSAIMGIILTAPISSAALAIMLGLSGLAGGAATAGCCAHMIGFAAASYRENRMAGLLSQGLGTSMLQVPNILRHPQILVPAVAASVITGPLATVIFKMQNSPLGAGMGTSGLVGPITTWITMRPATGAGVLLALILILYFILPALIALGVSAGMRKLGWIQPGQMKLDL
ncbi:MAG: PTS sugar transporter subunit IIC [Spirochaetales bacterium]|nr:PTS sugar transporter subunit IIC [Spirochaetales bacterium]